MSIAPPWRPGTKAAAKRDEAVHRILSGEDLTHVRKALRLDNYDVSMVLAHVHTSGTQARQELALERLRAGESMSSVRQQITLTRQDERLVAQRLRAEFPWLAILVLDPQQADEEWDCPGVSPHEATPTPDCVKLTWLKETPGDGRVVEHTCPCGMTEYELLSYGGLYRIRRSTVRTDIPPMSYTHGWRRPEAYDWWRRLLGGSAR